ncbi:hypothetical protein JOM56_011556 [Amanita muscaria]
MRFFGTKPKNSKPATRDTQSATGDRHFPTPIHEQHAVYTKHPAVNVPGLYPNSHLRDNMHQSPSDDQSLEAISNIDDAVHARHLAPSRASTLPSGASPPLHSPPLPRSPSPYNLVNSKNAPVKDRESPQVLRKKHPPSAPVTLGILRALDPSRQGELHGSQPSQMHSEERPPSSNGGHRERDKEAAEKKEKRTFWGTTKDRPSWIERSKEKDQKDEAELTRMIGYLTATASEDWMLVLEVCDRASNNETNAKEAVRALRREFKYGEPAAQLSAARLWAIMSRNCSGVFVAETSSRKFISTLEELIASTRTSPVVRERLLDVVAAAAYNSSKDSSFRNLWRRVKPADKPEEGIPFELDDEMINPPTANLRRSQIETNASPVTPSIPLPSNTLNVRPSTPSRRRRSPGRGRIISLEEDIRRLFQECHIGMGNAALLSDALVACKPERLKTDPVIREFYVKSRASQELIDSQIPWATAGAEHSRMSQSRTSQLLRPTNDPHADDEEQTIEERLLGDLLKANEELQSVLKQYKDLERVAFERHAENSVRKTTPIEPQYQDPDGWRSSGYSQSIDDTPSSGSPSPSIRSETPPRNSHPHDRSQTSLDIQGQLLAPPPAAPHGPRSPQPSLTSRTSPGIVVHDQRQQIDSHATRIPDVHDPSTASNIRLVDNHMQPISVTGDVHQGDGENVEHTPVRPSAKALGKRKLAESIPTNFDLDEPSDLESSLCTGDRLDSDPEEEERDAWLHPPVKYVYDAAAERTHRRIQQATAAMMVNGVH